MPTTIKLKNSVTTTATPTTLVQGEVAANVTDKKLWIGNAASSPVQLLGAGATVSGTDATFTGVTTVQAGTVLLPAITTTGDTNTGIFFPAADTIAFTEGGVESMRIDSSGRVGIGTSAPTAKLHISGTTPSLTNGSGQLQVFSTDALAANKGGKISLGGISGEGGSFDPYGFVAIAGLKENATSSNFAGYFTVSTSNSGGSVTERMRIDSSGNVGIGTTSVSNGRLNIVAGTASTGNSLFLSNTDGTYNPYLQVQHNGINGIKLVNTSSFGGSAGNLTISPAANCIFETGSTERMRIDSSGNVGIGATNPFAKFDVAQSSNATNSGRTGYIRSSWSGDVSTSALTVSKFDNNSTTSQIFVRFEINNTSTASGQINANGANTAAFGATSDERVKEKIVNLPSQLDNIMSLRPVEFNYIETYGGGHQIGFIAQEMQAVYPDVVSSDDSAEKILSITGWSKTEARLVKAIQEQQNLIENLTTRLNALEGK